MFRARPPFRLALLLLAVAVLAAPTAAEVIDSTPRGFTLENRIEVSQDPDVAWKALVNDVGRWWPRDHTWWGEGGELTIEPRAGGCFCEKDGDKEALHLQVTFVDPGKLLRLLGGLGPLQGMGLHGVLEFRLEALDSGGTAITLFYRAGGYTPDDLSQFAPVVDRVQAAQLGALGTYLSVK